jgi:hypothetical protein
MARKRIEVIVGAMPDSEDDTPQVQKRLCSAETFLHYLSVEIERYTRYNRIFTIVLIQPPASENHRDRLQVAWAAATHALELLRTCDVVSVFDRSACVVVLLPETDGGGASTVFDRFDEQMVQAGEGWTLKLAVYPKHSASVEYFLKRFSDLIRISNPETGISESDERLWHATSDVSSSWRDLTSAKEDGLRRSGTS